MNNFGKACFQSALSFPFMTTDPGGGGGGGVAKIRVPCVKENV